MAGGSDDAAATVWWDELRRNVPDRV